MKANWYILTLDILDYFIQALLIILGFVYPWIVSRGHIIRIIVFPLGLSFFWCLWRIAIFDSATNNDIPGIGYLVVGMMLSLLAAIFYTARCLFTRLIYPKHDAST